MNDHSGNSINMRNVTNDDVTTAADHPGLVCLDLILRDGMDCLTDRDPPRHAESEERHPETSRLGEKREIVGRPAAQKDSSDVDSARPAMDQTMAVAQSDHSWKGPAKSAAVPPVM